MNEVTAKNSPLRAESTMIISQFYSRNWSLYQKLEGIQGFGFLNVHMGTIIDLQAINP